MFRLFLAVLAAALLVAGLMLASVAMRVGRQAEQAASGAASTADSPPAKESDSGWLKEYTLLERSGRKFASSELDGKVHVVNFFFTACPTICRMQSAAVAALAKEFGPSGVVFLSITCDPDTDTPAQLAVYASQFEADTDDWLFLTGDLNYLRRVGAEVYFLPVDKGTHSESLLVLDRRGKIRGRFNWKRAQELADMKKMLAELLAEPVGAAAAERPAPADENRNGKAESGQTEEGKESAATAS